MPRTIRVYFCEDCGAWTRRARLSNEPRICLECGLDRRRNGWAIARRRHKIERQSDTPPSTCAQ